jgi:hypothetical protein
MTYKKRTKKNKKKLKRTKRNKKQKGGAYNIIELQNGLEYVNTIILYEHDFTKKINIEVEYNIYKINIKDCDYYFKKKSFEEDNYIVIMIKKDIYIVEINTDIYKLKYITDILDKLQPDIFELSVTRFKLQIKHILRENNILCEYFDNCVKYENIERPTNKINELNNLLNKKCPYNLSLNYLYNLEGKITTFHNNINYLVLCFYKDNTCISSVELVIYENNIEINSKTLNIYENRKINTLLRAVVIIIGNLFNNIRYIKSMAINPISAYILINRFKAQIYDDDYNDSFIEYLKLKKIENIEVETFKKFEIYNGSFSLNLTIELTDEDIENAKKVFDVILSDSEFICNPKESS